MSIENSNQNQSVQDDYLDNLSVLEDIVRDVPSHSEEANKIISSLTTAMAKIKQTGNSMEAQNEFAVVMRNADNFLNRLQDEEESWLK